MRESIANAPSLPTITTQSDNYWPARKGDQKRNKRPNSETSAQ